MEQNMRPALTGEVQARLWGARTEDWAAIQEPLVRPLYIDVLDRLEVGSVTRLLDAGCGSGLALAIAAERGAKVSGFDATPELLAIAERRVPAADLRQADLESPPFADATFDAVTGFNSFQYAGDPVAAVRQAGRKTKPGGRVAIAVWGTPEETQAAAYLKALGGLMPPAPPGAPGPFALSVDGALEVLARSAGLRPVHVASTECPWDYPDLDTALRGLLSAGPAIRAIAHSGEAAVRAAVTDAIVPYRRPSGSYRMENRFRFVIVAVD